ncbi:outer membrane protein assembly factor BamB family protein [Streptomyces meridianus]|uniref:PQQ-like beta-propeller repeat protein n=1 Tax=Streptomyces meridianus TaxID=2938945 RepID=A0ABT0XC64_9ACTN|nr:PQQ-binding-like beta-propeller repeat protein [Streptomyces meridianus]MCM2579855.1 PQQ-like beta-propeller repeat protein [Streptomyces meridianus]
MSDARFPGPGNEADTGGQPPLGPPGSPAQPPPGGAPGWGPQPPPSAGPDSAAGYGFPQQPAGPASGYGFPQQQQQQQQQPQAASGWGPQQPAAVRQPVAPGPFPNQLQAPPGPAAGPGMPPHPAAPRKKTGLVVLLVVALFLLAGAGGGGWYLLYGSPDKNVLWSMPAYGDHDPTNPPQENRGTWFTEKAVIQTLPDGLKAYDPANGKRLWATAIPGDGNRVCEAPSDSSGSVGIVTYGEQRACDHVAAFDLRSGRKLWHKDLPSNVGLARSGEVVVVSGEKANLALRTRDGSSLWNPRAFATKACGSGKFTGGKALIRVRGCSQGISPSKEWDEVSLIDPSTGRAKWTYRYPSTDVLGHEIAHDGSVISTSPIVLERGGKEAGLFALDEKTGKVRSEFSPPFPARYVQTQDPDGQPWITAGAFGDVFTIGVTEDKDMGLLAAYDLDSGKQLWKTKLLKFGRFVPLPAAGGDRVRAFVRDNDNDRGARLIEYDPRTGAENVVVEYPEDLDQGTTVHAMPHWNNGRIFVTSNGSPIVFEDQKAYSLVALPTE